MSIKKEIQELLQSTYGISFDVKEEYDHKTPYITIVPSNSENQLFSLHLSFQNSIRMNATFEPQKYAVQMVREMGHADNSKKLLFCEFANQLSSHGAKVSLRINDAPAEPCSYDKWASEWSKLSIRISVVPILFDDNDKPDYLNTILIWVPLIMGLSLSLLRVEKLDIAAEDVEGQVEGKRYEVVSTRYERSPINRTLCLTVHGYSCKVCGFNFEKTYGILGHEYIQVHHTTPVSQMGGECVVNPAKDLVPVCPNCHAMLHRKTPPVTIDELRELLR